MPRASKTVEAARQPKLIVDIVHRHKSWKKNMPAIDRLCRKWAKACFYARRDCYCVIALASDADLQDMNKTWRGKDKPTNVLSFANYDRKRLLAEFRKRSKEPIALGDIVISWQTVVREAKQQNKKTIDHAAHMVIHGILHLLGYDHRRDADASAMERLEKKILAGFGISDPYAYTICGEDHD